MENRGLYLCEVENSAGESHASVVVEVESKFSHDFRTALKIFEWLFLVKKRNF